MERYTSCDVEGLDMMLIERARTLSVVALAHRPE